MFNSFSFSELVTIMLVVVIVFGPNRLPEMARKLGRWSVKARQSVENLKRELGQEYKDVLDPLREARTELRGIKQELNESAKGVVSSLEDAAADVRDAAGVVRSAANADGKTPQPPSEQPDEKSPGGGGETAPTGDREAAPASASGNGSAESRQPSEAGTPAPDEDPAP